MGTGTGTGQPRQHGQHQHRAGQHDEHRPEHGQRLADLVPVLDQVERSTGSVYGAARTA